MSPAVAAVLVARLTLATGVTLEYVEQGPADGVPVILLHGVTDSWRSFEHVVPRLPASIRAIAITQRGHGNSSRPDAGSAYGDFAADVAAFMDARGIPQAVIVGHSMGGLVAQRFAHDYPSRVRGLVLPGARVVDYEGHGHAMHWEDPARVAGDIARFVAALPAASRAQD